jgi:hypothetical protein
VLSRYRLVGASIAATAILGSLVMAASASATFHLIKVREVSPGTNGLDNSYVEVQMYAPFQRYLSGGAKVAVCNNICSLVPAEFSGFSDVANGNSQDTVLFGDSGVPGGSKDFNVNLNLDQVEPGGAVCYVSEPGYSDCVSWGNFNANSTLTANYDGSADPGSPATALTSGMALRRSIAAGCSSMLEGSDDTNNSAADVAVTTPDPRPNSVAPTEMACGATTPPTGTPTQPTSPAPHKKKKCKKHKRSSSTPGTGSGTTTNPPAYAAKKKCKKKRK